MHCFSLTGLRSAITPLYLHVMQSPEISSSAKVRYGNPLSHSKSFLSSALYDLGHISGVACDITVAAAGHAASAAGPSLHMLTAHISPFRHAVEEQVLGEVNGDCPHWLNSCVFARVSLSLIVCLFTRS